MRHEGPSARGDRARWAEGVLGQEEGSRDELSVEVAGDFTERVMQTSRQVFPLSVIIKGVHSSSSSRLLFFASDDACGAGGKTMMMMVRFPVYPSFVAASRIETAPWFGFPRAIHCAAMSITSWSGRTVAMPREAMTQNKS